MTSAAGPATAAVDAAPRGALELLKRDADAGQARLVLGIAARVRGLSDSEHPDLVRLRAAGVTVTGRPANLVHAAVELVSQEFADASGVGLPAALSTVWEAWYDATDRGVLWQAVAEGRISTEQARTIQRRAAGWSSGSRRSPRSATRAAAWSTSTSSKGNRSSTPRSVPSCSRSSSRRPSPGLRTGNPSRPWRAAATGPSRN